MPLVVIVGRDGSMFDLLFLQGWCICWSCWRVGYDSIHVGDVVDVAVDATGVGA